MSLHEINLLIQFFILVVFLTSLVFKWKKNYFIHGTLMLIAVISYLTSFVWYVSSIPSIYTATEIMDAFFGNYLTMSVFAIHVILGLSSGLLAILIVGSWRLRSTQFCTKNKKKMRYTATLWIPSYIIGVMLYALLHTNLII